MEYPEGYGFAYIALIRKVDGKEVYSSPAKMNEEPWRVSLFRIMPPYGDKIPCMVKLDRI